jgi:3-phenylpropionate/trans-cinnamate dioxygenase ferredoxin component
MGEPTIVATMDELKPGTMKMANIKGHEILVARVGDSYFASDNRCPHLGGNLSQGKLEGTVVTCPRHGSQFDLSNGHVVRWTSWTGLLGSANKAILPPRPLKTYAVTIKEDRSVSIEI